jgi:peroxiredoxin
VEEYCGLEIDRRYRLVQGRGEPVEVTPRSTQLALKPSVQQIPKLGETARIRLVTLLPIPKMRFPGGPGEQSISIGAGKPVLLTLWASWCTPCLEELAEITKRADEIRSAGIEVVALSVDKASDLDSAVAKLKTMRFPFYSAPAPQPLVMLLQWYHDELTQQEIPMPIPVSFLIDGQGRLVALYKGRVVVDDVVADVGRSQDSRARRWVDSAPLPGRSIEHPLIERIANLYDMSIYLRMATSLLSSNRAMEAATYYREVLRMDPDQVTALNNLAWLLSTHASDKIRNGVEASELAMRLVRSSGQPSANQLDTLAAALAEAGRFSEAVSTAKQAITKAHSEHLDDLAKTIEQRLALYEKSQPYHDSPN